MLWTIDVFSSSYTVFTLILLFYLLYLYYLINFYSSVIPTFNFALFELAMIDQLWHHTLLTTLNFV